ncbi:MAG: orotate phosphoribosyltransferase [Halobacteria archaeon]
MEEMGMCSLCRAPGKMYTCHLCGRSTCVRCTTSQLACKACVGDRKFEPGSDPWRPLRRLVRK